MNEGFYVNGPNGKRIEFGKSLLRHLDEGHDRKDVEGRKQRLLYAVNAVMFPAKSENNHRSIPGRTAYFKDFGKFGIQAISAKEGDFIEYVFTYIPKRNRKGGGK